MTLFHHEHRVPFDDAGFHDPVGDRAALKEEIGRLRRRLNTLETAVHALTVERDLLKAQTEKRRWRR